MEKTSQVLYLSACPQPFLSSPNRLFQELMKSLPTLEPPFSKWGLQTSIISIILELDGNAHFQAPPRPYRWSPVLFLLIALQVILMLPEAGDSLTIS